MKRRRRELPRRSIVEQSLAQYGAIVVVDDLDEACAIVNEMAPEHLQIMTGDEEGIALAIRHAGAIFFGEQTPEAVGDYLAGPNHVLPTGRCGAFLVGAGSL